MTEHYAAQVDESGMPAVVPTDVALVCPRQQAPKPGQEVTISYGDKSNEGLLMSYGTYLSGFCRVVLCCAVLCCAVLCCAVLCCAVLCCAVLCCAVLCCAVLCDAVLFMLCCAVLCCAALRCTVLCCYAVLGWHALTLARLAEVRRSVLSCHSWPSLCYAGKHVTASLLSTAQPPVLSHHRSLVSYPPKSCSA